MLIHFGWYLGIVFLFLFSPQAYADSNPPKTITLVSLIPGITRAKFIVYPAENSRGSVVIVPGENQSPESFLQDPLWRKFCEQQQLNLVGVHFESPSSLLRLSQGYFDAKAESGLLFWKAREQFDPLHRPLYFYGFSGGAHFVHSLALNNPKQVSGWVAYSAATWENAIPEFLPAGILACGEKDGQRYGATLTRCQSLRRAGFPLIWISLRGQPHSRSAALEKFSREFFAILIDPLSIQPIAYDNLTRKRVLQRWENNPLTSVLPSESLFQAWSVLHQP